MRLNSLFASIRTRLIVLVLVGLLPAASLVLYGALQQRRSDETNARVQADQATQLISGQYVDSRERVRQLLGALAALDIVEDPALCDRATATMIERFRQFMNLGMADLDGNVVCSGLVSPGPQNVADRAYFQQAIATNDFAEGGFQISRLTGKPSMGFAYPVRDERGQVRGVMLSTVDLTWLSQLIARVKIPPGSTMTLLDKYGTVLARFPEPEKWVGRAVADSDLFRRIASEPAGRFEARGLDTEERLYSYARLGDATNPVYVTFGVPTSLAFAGADRNLRTSLLFLGLVAAFALASAWAFGETFVVRKMRSVRNAARQLSRGDLSARTGEAHGPSEISELARTFDDMAASLELRQLESERFQADLTKKVAQLNALHGVFSKITEKLSVHEVVQAALEQALEMVEAEVVVLRLLKDGVLEVAGSVSKSADTVLDLHPVKLGEGLMGGVAASGKAVRIDRNVVEFMSAGQGIGGAQSGIAVPVMFHGKVLGTLGCWSLRPRAFEREIELVLEMLATQIAAAIAAADARDNSERLARIDALTGLPNRLQLTEDAAAIRATGPCESLMVAMVDIDHFKLLNDSWGHPYGDVVLKTVARTLKSALRADDHIYRFGGEEFLVIAPCRDAAAAADFAQRLRLAVGDAEFEKGQNLPNVRVTVSIGVSLFPDACETLDQAIELADEALYEAKESGRNRVQLWEGPASVTKVA